MNLIMISKIKKKRELNKKSKKEKKLEDDKMKKQTMKTKRKDNEYKKMGKITEKEENQRIEKAEITYRKHLNQWLHKEYDDVLKSKTVNKDLLRLFRFADSEGETENFENYREGVSGVKISKNMKTLPVMIHPQVEIKTISKILTERKISEKNHFKLKVVIL